MLGFPSWSFSPSSCGMGDLDAAWCIRPLCILKNFEAGNAKSHISHPYSSVKGLSSSSAAVASTATSSRNQHSRLFNHWQSNIHWLFFSSLDCLEYQKLKCQGEIPSCVDYTFPNFSFNSNTIPSLGLLGASSALPCNALALIFGVFIIQWLGKCHKFAAPTAQSGCVQPRPRQLSNWCAAPTAHSDDDKP